MVCKDAAVVGELLDNHTTIIGEEDIITDEETMPVAALGTTEKDVQNIIGYLTADAYNKVCRLGKILIDTSCVQSAT